MIKTKADYEFYKQADELAIGRSEEVGIKRRLLYFVDNIWKFERLLRKTEYYQNCKNSKLNKVYSKYLKYELYKNGTKLGFTISPNCFGPGLSIAHIGTIVVNPASRIGANCRIHTCVVIGTKAGYPDMAPTIGNNVYIGPGAKIFGKITISDGIAIGANSVVNKSFFEPNVTIAGVPARKISDKGSKDLLVNATQILKEKQLKYQFDDL